MRTEDLVPFVKEAPRYTSYPTAAEFSPAIGEVAHAANLGACGPRTPLSLYVHLPFCASLCAFCGCHALVAHTEERIEGYLTALRTEMDLVARALGGAGAVAELHFGGGSPSLLPAPAFERLMEDLRQRFSIAGEAAIALEADPRTTCRDKLEAYRRQGVARLSFGFQDLDENVQRAIGRNQSAATSRGAYQLARAVGFEGINIDLCYGLPEQTAATFARTVDETIALRPDRIALFGYAHVPWLRPRQKLIVASSLPGIELRLRLVADAEARLTAAGYLPIGLDHFALPTDSLAEAARDRRLHRNFQGYTVTRTEALVGLGLSAISDLPAGYAQNARTLRGYYAALAEGRLPTERGAARSADDRLRGEVIRQIMCTFRIDRMQVERAHAITFADTFRAELAALGDEAHRGLVTLGDEVIELTELGRRLVRNVAMVFDAYRRPDQPRGAEETTAATASVEASPRFSSSV